LEDAYSAERRGDYAAAVKLFNSLATQNDPAAQLALGLMHTRGKGVPPDLDEALKWFRLAAENRAASQTTRDDAISNRDFLSRKLKERAEAEAAAAARLQRSDAATARQLEASRETAAAEQELRELQVQNERSRLKILQQAQR